MGRSRHWLSTVLIRACVWVVYRDNGPLISGTHRDYQTIIQRNGSVSHAHPFREPTTIAKRLGRSARIGSSRKSAPYVFCPLPLRLPIRRGYKCRRVDGKNGQHLTTPRRLHLFPWLSCSCLWASMLLLGSCLVRFHGCAALLSYRVI